MTSAAIANAVRLLDVKTWRSAVRHVGTDLVVGTDLTGTASLHFEVDSNALAWVTVGRRTSPDWVIPVYRRSPRTPGGTKATKRPLVERAIVAELDVFGERRTIRSAPMDPASPWAATFPDVDKQQIEDYYLVRLKSSEIADFPLLTVLAPTRRGSAARRGWLSPVGTLLVDVPETPPRLAVRLDVPEILDVDAVGVRCSLLTGTDYLDEIDEITAKALASASERDYRVHSLRVWVRSYRGSATKLVQELDRMIAIAESELGGDERSTQRLLEQLAKGRKELDGWFARHRGYSTDLVSRETADAAGAELRDIASRALMPVVVPGQLRHDIIEYEPSRLFRSVVGVVVPYSSKRSSREWLRPFLLGVLALVQVAVAWRVRWPFDLWFAGEAGDGYLTSRYSLKQSAEAIVAVLLIFPALLYGQFAQLRPETVAQQHSRLGTFILLSSAFILPLVPIMLVLGDANPNSVALWLTVSACCSIIGAVLAVVTSAPRYLKRIRARRTRRRWQRWALSST